MTGNDRVLGLSDPTLSLPLTDPGFDFSILSEFRTRLVTGGMEQVLGTF